MNKTFLILISICVFTVSNARTKKADKLFQNWDYYRAAIIYEREANRHPSADIYYKLGECYLKMNDFNKALYNFNKVTDSGAYDNPTFYFDYGLVLKNAGYYDEARDAFKKYTRLMPGDKRGKFYLESCDIAEEDNKHDLPIIVKPVITLNSSYADFNPVLYRDGIVFTSSRGKENSKKIDHWSGEYYLNLFYAKKGENDLAFSDISPFKDELSQKYHDGPASFSGTNDTIYFARVERDLRGQVKWTLGVEKIKIYSAIMEEGKWEHLQSFYLNNDSFSVSDPFINKNGSRLYFVSDRPGGYGQTDIWYCVRTASGWSKPYNMGPKVNTFGKERSPYEDEEGNFYFASDGYQGFGGLDICVAVNSRGVLAKAIPLKEPLNSPGDDFGILSMNHGKTGYLTSNRTGGKGDDDIYYFDMAGNNGLVTKVYTIGYRPEDTPPVTEKKRETILASNNTPATVVINTPPITKHDTIILTNTKYTTITTTVDEDEFDLPDEVIPPNLDKDNPSFGLIAHFGRNQADIRPEDFEKLNTIAGWLKKHPDQEMWVEGHTDTRANEGFNIKLSMRRAESAINYLILKGVSRHRMTAVGYGYSRLVNFCGKGRTCPELMQEANRRVEFKLKKQ